MVFSGFNDAHSRVPLAKDSPAAHALIAIRPENEAAKLAFSSVVDFINEQKSNSDALNHYAKFIWCSDERVHDPAVSRYAAWKSDGFFFVDESVLSLGSNFQWIIGRLSNKTASLTKPDVDLLLTTERESNVARRHATISFAQETRLATITLESGSSMIVNKCYMASRGSVAGCALAKNFICLGDLKYSLEYTPYSRQDDGQKKLRNMLTAVYGSDQPTNEIHQAAPTPSSMNALTIGNYTVTSGTGSSIRPAVSSDGQKIVAVKSLAAETDKAVSVREKFALMELITLEAKAQNHRNILRMVENIHIPGREVHEYHLILEPFVGLTQSQLPQRTHNTKIELILHDCLRVLAFLNEHNIIHTNVNPANIGLLDFHMDEIDQPAILSSLRPPRAVILGIDSVQEIPAGQSTIEAVPGSSGTVGYHAPEHELLGYDGRTDVWSLGVSVFETIFGELPWAFGVEGNPWRKDCKNVNQARFRFNLQFEKAIDKIKNHRKTYGEAITSFLRIAFRFEHSKIDDQRQHPRLTSEQCIILIEKKSIFLKHRVVIEGVNAGGTVTIVKAPEQTVMSTKHEASDIYI
ncbi:kinase-like protein [Trichoderma evansii]